MPTMVMFQCPCCNKLVQATFSCVLPPPPSQPVVADFKNHSNVVPHPTGGYNVSLSSISTGMPDLFEWTVTDANGNLVTGGSSNSGSISFDAGSGAAYPFSVKLKATRTSDGSTDEITVPDCVTLAN